MKKFTKTEIKAISKYVKQGKSQYKIAKALHTRKQNISSFLAKKKLGKRAANEFWKDVKTYKELEDITRKEAIKHVKYAPKWFKKRQKRLSAEEKARDAMRKLWYDVEQGKIDADEMLKTVMEEEGLISEAGYA